MHRRRHLFSPTTDSSIKGGASMLSPHREKVDTAIQPERAMSVREAANLMGIGVNALRAHLNKVGYDEEGQPLYYLTSENGKKLIWLDQLPLIRASLPSPPAKQKRGAKRASRTAAYRSGQRRLAELTETRR